MGAAFFVVALACASYSLVVLSFIAEWRAFYAMVIVWLALNTFCLAKAVRERHEAARCNGLPVERQNARVLQIIETCEGTREYRALVWTSLVASVSLMLGSMWMWSSEVLALERKGYFSGMVLWSLVSS